MAWISLAIAPTVAAIQVWIAYMLVKPACGSGHVSSLMLLSVALAVVTAAGAFAGWRARGRFLGMIGLAINVLVLVLVFASSFAPVIKPPCE